MFALTWQWSSHETHTQSDSTLQNDSVGLEKMRELNAMVGNFFFLRKMLFCQSVRSKLGRLEIFFFYSFQALECAARERSSSRPAPGWRCGWLSNDLQIISGGMKKSINQ